MKNARSFLSKRLLQNLLTIAGVVCGLALPVIAQAQGIIQGRISSEEGAPISGAQVTVTGGYTATSDQNGNYKVELPAGSYIIQFARDGFSEESLIDIAVTDGQTSTRNVQLSVAPTGGIEELFVIGRAAMEGSTASVLSLQREATMVTEFSGSEEFSRLGDSTAADTLKRITGLTVEDNKFVVIRGQPKRYTSTIFYGSLLPSLDPINQITPLDLFPSGVLSNIAVQKAYTADRVGSFGSGQVQLSTSGMHSEDFLEVQVGTGWNQSMDEDGVEFNTGGDRWANIDSILKLPEGVREVQESGTPIATLPAAQRLELARSFPDELAPGYLKNMGPDGSFTINAGKRIDTDSASFGVSVNLDYGQKARVEQESNITLMPGQIDPIAARDTYETSRSTLNTNLGGMLALAGEWDNHRLKSNTFWVRDATEKTQIDEGLFQFSNTQFLRRFLLEYERRELLMQQFAGHHDFSTIQIDWRLLAANATRDLPDRRSFQLDNTQLDGSGIWRLDPNTGFLNREFSTVDEDSYSGGFDLTLPFTGSDSWTVTGKTGFDYDFQDRLSELRSCGFVNNGNSFAAIEQIFADENIGTTVSFSETAGGANDYTSEVEIIGGYAQLDFEMLERFRLVAGARLEDANFQVTTFEGRGAFGVDPIESGFDTQKVLPSLAGSWSLSEDSQVRASLTRSLSYPATVEVSATSYIDAEEDQKFFGNPDLEPAVIDSVDLRWEWYPASVEAVTVGAFYKDFSNPIERTYLPVAGSDPIISNINGDSADVYGLELNGFLGVDRLYGLGGSDDVPEWLSDIHLGLNFAWQDSEVKISEVSSATNPVRRMTGQPDTLLNLQLGYTGNDHIFTLKFSRVGERLITANIDGLPDEFLDPRFDLGFKWSWSPSDWPMLEPLTVSLEVENLLNDAYERSTGDIITRTYKTGISALLGIKWRFDTL